MSPPPGSYGTRKGSDQNLKLFLPTKTKMVLDDKVYLLSVSHINEYIKFRLPLRVPTEYVIVPRAH